MFDDNGLERPPWEDVLPALEAAGASHEAELGRRGWVPPGVEQAGAAGLSVESLGGQA